MVSIDAGELPTKFDVRVGGFGSTKGKPCQLTRLGQSLRGYTGRSLPCQLTRFATNSLLNRPEFHIDRPNDERALEEYHLDAR